MSPNVRHPSGRFIFDEVYILIRPPMPNGTIVQPREARAPNTSEMLSGVRITRDVYWRLVRLGELAMVFFEGVFFPFICSTGWMDGEILKCDFIAGWSVGRGGFFAEFSFGKKIFMLAKFVEKLKFYKLLPLSPPSRDKKVENSWKREISGYCWINLQSNSKSLL